MRTKPRTTVLNEAIYRWICEAFDYDASSSFGAAANVLSLLRMHTISGAHLAIIIEAEKYIVTTGEEFDRWVYKYFPFLANTPYYPNKARVGELADFISSNIDKDAPNSQNPVEFRQISNSIAARDSGIGTPVGSVLHIFSLLNHGENHEANYRFVELEDMGSLESDIVNYFRGISPLLNLPWSVKTEQYDGQWEELVLGVADTWFFRQQFSPEFDSQKSKKILDALVSFLRSETSATKCYRLNVSPPVFYECFWEDIVLEGRSRRWLLHFGHSD